MGKGLAGENKVDVEPGGKQVVLAILGGSDHLEQCPPQPFYLQVPPKGQGSTVRGRNFINSPSACSPAQRSPAWAKRRAEMPNNLQTGLNILQRTPGYTSIAAEVGVQPLPVGSTVARKPWINTA